MAGSEMGEGSGHHGVFGPRLRRGATRIWDAAKRPFRAIRPVLYRTPLSTLLLAGLAVRLVLTPFTSWTHDVYPFYRAAVDTIGGLNPYLTSVYTYPPLFAYVLFPLNLLLGLLVGPEGFAQFVPFIAPTAEVTEGIVPRVTSPLFNLVLKLPLIAADLGVALVLLAWTSSTFGESRGRTAFLLWFFNPLVIWVTVLQGQFEVIPVFLTLTSAFLLLRRRYLFSGLALGLGVLFKVYPLFLILPLVFLAAAWGRSHPRDSKPGHARGLPSWILFLLGNGIVFAALALPVVFSTPFLEVTLFRRVQFTMVGGFQPLFILTLDIWERLEFGRILLQSLPEFPYVILIVIPIAISILAGIFVLRRTHLGKNAARAEAAIAFLTVVPLVALYSALPLVQPQYLLWVLPFLILASAVWNRLYLTTIIISLAGLAFLIALQGVAVFLYPLAVFTSLIGIEAIHAQVVGYWGLPGLVSSQLQRDILALAAGTGYMFLLYAAYRVTKSFRASREEVKAPAAAHAPTNPGDLPQAERSLRITVGALALFLVASQAFVLIQDVPMAGDVVRISPDSVIGSVRVDVRGHTLFPSTYRATAIALGVAPLPMPVYLYYDETYPITNSSRPRIFGLTDHLRSEMSLAGTSADLRLVDAFSLPSLLRGPPAVLIMASTAWPATILPGQPTLVRDWLEAGGVLVWSGALMGVYAGNLKGEVLDLRVEFPTQTWGPSVILGFDPVRPGGPNRTSASSAWGAALGIRSPLATWGARLSEIETHGGLALGGLTAEPDPKVSLSLLPVGAGSVALFGDAIGPVFTYSAEDVVAHDIARLLLSGLLLNPSTGDARLLGSEPIALGAGQRGGVSLPMQMPPTARRLVVLVFSEVEHDPLLRAVPFDL